MSRRQIFAQLPTVSSAYWTWAVGLVLLLAGCNQAAMDGTAAGQMPAAKRDSQPLESEAIADVGQRDSVEAPPLSGKPELTDAEIGREVAERNRWSAESQRLVAEGKLAEAIAAAERFVAIDRRIFDGGPARGLGSSLAQLARLHVAHGDFEAAQRIRREAVEVNTRHYGADSHFTVDARLALEHMELLPRLTESQRGELARSNQLSQEAVELSRQRRHGEAIVRAEEAVAIRKEVLGERHDAYASALNDLGAFYQSQGEYEPAKAVLEQALAIRRQVLGEGHPGFAESLNNLGAVCKALGEPERAKTLLQQALAIKQKALGKTHADCASTLYNLVDLYREAGDLERAAALLSQATEIEKQTRGDTHGEYVASLTELAELQLAREDFAAVHSARQELLSIHVKLYGKEDFRATNARWALTDAGLLQGMTKEQRQRWSRARQLQHEAPELYEEGRHQEATARLVDAEPVLRELLGVNHPDYADNRRNLAEMYRLLGNFGGADPLYREASELNRLLLGESHPAYHMNLAGLADLYSAMGDFERAEPLRRQVVHWHKTLYGENHYQYARALNDLANLYQLMGEDEQAEQLYLQTLAIFKTTHGETSLFYVGILNNLAGLYYAMGDDARAEQMVRQVLEIKAAVPVDSKVAAAVHFDSLAEMYTQMGDHARAESLSLQAVEIRKQEQGENHPDYAASLSLLAGVYMAKRDYPRAEPLYSRVVEIRKHALGESHPDYIAGLNNLGFVYQCMENYTKAESQFRQALELTGKHLEATAVALSERQQITMSNRERRQLDSYCSCAARAGEFARAAYGYVFKWKGAVLQRQRLTRLIRSSSDPQVQALFTELELICTQLATRALSAPPADQVEVWQQQLDDLTERKERLEADLARASSEFRNERAKTQLTPEQLQAILPTDVALVDLFVYTHREPPAADQKEKHDLQERVLAFVIRPGREIAMIPLGSPAQLSWDVEYWREGFGQKNAQGVFNGLLNPAAQLRAMLWEPLEPHLAGATTVLVSPDGVTATLPWGALPGSKPNSYLLEEISLAVIPVPQMLPELLTKQGEDRADSSGAMVLVGDVDFAAATGPELVTADLNRPTSRAAARDGNGPLRFDPLPGTAREIDTIASLAQRTTASAQSLVQLRGAEATEAALRRLAPRCRWLHLATHGYFAPDKLRSAQESATTPLRLMFGKLAAHRDLSGFSPGLLSGIALAGANQPPQPEQDDGILTALEVEPLDLSQVELAVLSACESGLGRSAGGEGILGLQRALQIAGARATITSLWKVDDAATQTLMTEFYRNLWEGKLGKLEALRKAQLWMLRNGAKQPEIKRALAARGLVAAEGIGDRGQGTENMLPPYYWGAWVLSGDWR